MEEGKETIFRNIFSDLLANYFSVITMKICSVCHSVWYLKRKYCQIPYNKEISFQALSIQVLGRKKFRTFILMHNLLTITSHKQQGHDFLKQIYSETSKNCHIWSSQKPKKNCRIISPSKMSDSFIRLLKWLDDWNNPVTKTMLIAFFFSTRRRICYGYEWRFFF